MSSKSFKIVITGDKKLDKKLREIASEDGVKGINAAARKSTRESIKQIVLPQVRDYVPVDSGFLESQITVKSIARSRAKLGSAVGFKNDLFKGDTFYAGFHEYGYHGRGGSIIFGDSFLRGPLYRNESQVKAKLMSDLRSFVRSKNR